MSVYIYIYIYADVCITGGEEGTCTSFPDMPLPHLEEQPAPAVKLTVFVLSKYVITSPLLINLHK